MEFTKNLKFIFLLNFLIILLISACDLTTEVDTVIETSSPIVTPVEAVVSPLSSPIATPEPKATPTQISLQVRIPVVLDEPIKIGATTVSGTGPPNVPIKIFEVANTANLLGELTIPEDGKFSITFEDRPLQATERVGVTLGDLSNTPLEEQFFKDISIRDVPTYGYILAEVAVEP